jgi:uncharacterized glyoxalase superfamily protein PhnB
MEQTIPFRYNLRNRTLRSEMRCGPRRKELAVPDANNSAEGGDGIRPVPEGAPWGTPGFFRLYVEDGDAVYRRALEAGAVSVTDMTHLFFGDPVGRVRDPQGNVWWIQSRVEEVDAEEIEKRAGEKGYAEAMHYVQESLDHELGSRSRG